MTAVTGRPRRLDAYLDLMDHQVVDHDGRMLAKVDDLELEERDDGRLYLAGLLTGPGALGPRLGGALGEIVRRTWSRLSGRSEPARVDWSQVARVDSAVTLAVDRDTVRLDGFETWMRDRVIAAIPGSKVLPR